MPTYILYYLRKNHNKIVRKGEHFFLIRYPMNGGDLIEDRVRLVKNVNITNYSNCISLSTYLFVNNMRGKLNH